MVSEILLLTVFMAFLIVVVMLLALRSESSSRPAQRRHDDEYAPAGNVYVVLQTNNYYDDNRTYDNRQLLIGAAPHPEWPQAPQGMPLIAVRQREIQQRAEWQTYEHNGFLPAGHSGMREQ